MCFDASTLINFAEAGAIALLANHFRDRALIAAYVEDNELSATIARGVAIVEHGNSRWIERVELSGAAELRLAEDIQLTLGARGRHRGESESIVVCQNHQALLATDDDGAARIARSRKVRCASTIEILQLLVAKHHLSQKQALELADRMHGSGQNVDPRRLQA